MSKELQKFPIGSSTSTNNVGSLTSFISEDAVPNLSTNKLKLFVNDSGSKNNEYNVNVTRMNID